MISEKMYVLGSKQSCIREIFEFGLKRKQQVGEENVFDYSLGNPSIPTHKQVDNTITTLIQTKNSLMLHGYPPAGGDKRAREAIAEDLNERYGMNISSNNLLLTCGAAAAVIASLKAIAVKDSEVIVIAPYFPEYPMYAESSGMKLVTVPADTEAFQIRFDELEKRITPHTQAVIVNSPNNPSGAVYGRETLCRLGRLLEQRSAEYGHPIYIIADEPYRELVYDGAEVTFIPKLYANTIVCYSYSKSMSLPGERIGYACVTDEAEDSHELLLAISGASRSMGHVCAPSTMQQMLARCVKLRPDVEAYDRNRRTLYDALAEYGYKCVKPKGAFYLFVEAPGGDAKEFAARAMRKDLLVVPGNEFGCPGHFRLSTCVSHDMIKRSLPIFRELAEEMQA